MLLPGPAVPRPGRLEGGARAVLVGRWGGLPAYDRPVASFRIERLSPWSVEESWRRLTDFRRHAAAVPLTAITVITPPPTGVGTRFTARTALGPLGFADPMEVVNWEPPEPGRAGYCRLEKRGRVIVGWAEIEVRPHPAGAQVGWLEELRVRGMPRLFDPVVAGTGRLLFQRVVGALLAE